MRLDKMTSAALLETVAKALAVQQRQARALAQAQKATAAAKSVMESSPALKQAQKALPKVAKARDEFGRGEQGARKAAALAGNHSPPKQCEGRTHSAPARTGRRARGAGRPAARPSSPARSRGGDSGDSSGSDEPGPQGSGRPLQLLVHWRWGRVNLPLPRTHERVAA